MDSQVGQSPHCSLLASNMSNKKRSGTLVIKVGSL